MILVMIVRTSIASACLENCLELWSSAEDGGALVVKWEFAQKVQVFESFCTGERAQCLYTAIDPGFLTPLDDLPDDNYFPLRSGTKVRLDIVSIAAGLTISINGQRLQKPGDAATIGTAPEIHGHPSWQLLIPGSALGNYLVSFRVKPDTGAYSESSVYTVTVTNDVPVVAPTATATAVPTPQSCAGDCDGSGEVTVDELLTGITMALAGDRGDCEAIDSDGNHQVTVDEIVTAVTRALSGCDERTPIPVTLETVQREVFNQSCLSQGCHNARDAVQGLILESGQSHSELVGVVPENLTASSAGFRLVDPGNPANSFLLVKLLNPRPEFGSQMPLGAPQLSITSIDLVRSWILQGAKP